MPSDSLLLSLAVFITFLGFAGVLAWADYSTSKKQRSQASDKPEAPVQKHAA